jgi:hypothetical protein
MKLFSIYVWRPHYQADVVANQWKIIGVTAVTTIITCLLLVWLLIPKPTLPLSNEQLKYLNSGVMMELVWPKLTEKEQTYWLKLANEVQYPKNGSDNQQTDTNQ